MTLRPVSAPLLFVLAAAALASSAGAQSFGAQQVITTSVNGARSVYATDLDGDGDADVLSASYRDDKIAWYETRGGGVSGAQHVITTSADGALSVYATDLDGDADVLSASLNDHKIAWYQNQGGGVFGTQQVITTSADTAPSVYATDLDGDGDADVLSASAIDDKIAWYENQNPLIYSGVSCSVTDHSGGYPADLVALGTHHVSANSFSLKVSQLPRTETTAYLLNAFLSPQQSLSVASNPSIGGVAASGNVCIAGGIFGRHLFGNDIYMGAGGSFEVAVDLTDLPSPRNGIRLPTPAHYSTTVLAGETWYWQCWFRDAQEGAGHSNFSNAISVTFQ